MGMDQKEIFYDEVFAEIVLFGCQDQEENGSIITADCGCFNCDGNPCVEGTD